MKRNKNVLNDEESRITNVELGITVDNDSNKFIRKDNSNVAVRDKHDPLLQIYFDINPLTTSSTQSATSYVNESIGTSYSRKGKFIRTTWRQSICNGGCRKRRPCKCIHPRIKLCFRFILLMGIFASAYLVYMKYLEAESSFIFSTGDDASLVKLSNSIEENSFNNSTKSAPNSNHR